MTGALVDEDLENVVHFLDPPDTTYWLTRTFYLRFLGFIYFIAFLSLSHQLIPLIGAHGLTPAPLYIDHVRGDMGGSTWAAFKELPSVFWYFGCSDSLMLALCYVGLAMSVLVMAGVTNAILMAATWFLYMSYVHIGQIWYGFGWETMTLEAGFLAIFLCPVMRVSPFAADAAPPRAMFWFIRWMLFRVMFGAGLIKLRGDPCWRDLTCLAYHYETQPIPNPASWLLFQLPLWAHGIGVLFNHFIELFVSFLVFGPRRTRRIAGALMVAFQVILIISGNLSFLNWLTIAICIPCFDDGFLRRLVPARIKTRLDALGRGTPAPRARRFVIGSLSLLLLFLSINPIRNMLSPNQVMNTSFDPLEIMNTYGAFGYIGKIRDEVILQGTYDNPLDPNAAWLEYEFKAKPGDVNRRPPVVAPYQYRIDWEIWFAAMSNYQHHPWLVHLIYKLLQGDKDALSLLRLNPFGDRPPRYIRAELYEYHFTKWGDKTGAWWRRERVAPYFPAVSINDPGLRQYLAAYGWEP